MDTLNQERLKPPYQVVELPTWHGSKYFGRKAAFAYNLPAQDVSHLSQATERSPLMQSSKTSGYHEKYEPQMVAVDKYLADTIARILNLQTEVILDDPLFKDKTRVHLLDGANYQRVHIYPDSGTMNPETDEILINMSSVEESQTFCSAYAEEMFHRLMVRIYEQNSTDRNDWQFIRVGLDFIDTKSKVYGYSQWWLNEGLAAIINQDVRRQFGEDSQIESDTRKNELYHIAFTELLQVTGLEMGDFLKAMTDLPKSAVDRSRDPILALMDKLIQARVNPLMLQRISDVIRPPAGDIDITSLSIQKSSARIAQILRT